MESSKIKKTERKGKKTKLGKCGREQNLNYSWVEYPLNLSDHEFEKLLEIAESAGLHVMRQ